MTMLTIPGRWPFTRVLMMLLAGAFAGLMTDIRVEHVAVVRQTWEGWIPIAYAGMMAAACAVTVAAWNGITRRIMLGLFVTGFLVGAAGFYFHNRETFTRVPADALHAWTDSQMKRLRGPPEVAPLAFGGLGLVGALACLKRFD